MPVTEDLSQSLSLSKEVVGNQGASPIQGSHPSSPVSTHPEIPAQDPIMDSLLSSSRQLVSYDSDSSHEETEDQGSRTFIAPSVTSLEGAKNISSAGTSTLDVGTSLSVREQLTEFVIQNPSAQPSVQSMSDMRETPAERSSGNPTLTQPTHETTTPTVSVTEF